MFSEQHVLTWNTALTLKKVKQKSHKSIHLPNILLGPQKGGLQQSEEISAVGLRYYLITFLDLGMMVAGEC